jgi:enolase
MAQKIKQIGANATLAVYHLAVAKQQQWKASFRYSVISGGVNATVLPMPLMNIMNGGAHADNKIGFPGIHDRSNWS